MAVTALRRSEAGLGDRQFALAEFLKAETGAAAVDITRVELLGGGAIQENWGVDASFEGGSLAGTQRLVLRTDASTGVPSSLGRVEEFHVLRAAFAAGVTVPRPLFACADKTVLGKPCFVMRRVAGSAAGRPITSTRHWRRRARHWRSGSGTSWRGCRRSARHARISRFSRPMTDRCRGSPNFAPISTHTPTRGQCSNGPCAGRRGRNLPEPLPTVLCHRDFRTGNYLLEGAGLTAILDWECAGWGDPDEDIGWMCCKGWRFGRLDREVGGIADRAPFYRGYEAESGRRLDPERVKFWEVFANIRWAIIALQQSDRFLLGGARSLSTAITGRRATECELELLMLLDGDGALPEPSPAREAGKASVLGMRDLPAAGDLLALARELLLDELAPLLPPERRRDAHLVATVMAIMAREREGEAWREQVLQQLAEFSAEGPQPLRRLAVPVFCAMEGSKLPHRNRRRQAQYCGGWTIEKLREGEPAIPRRQWVERRNKALGGSRLPRSGNSDPTTPRPDPDPQPRGDP